VGECINLFLNNTGGSSGGGHANMSGNRWIEMKGTWEGYSSGNVHSLWATAGTLNHEVGHNLSLLHTMRTNSGVCNNNFEDYCPDTPTRQEIMDTYGFDACCGWNGGANCSNNLMDYSGADALTPEQLGRVHWTIANEIEDYQTCFFSNPLVSITSFTDNQSFIGKNVSIPSSSSITVDDGEAMFVNAKEFEVVGEIEIGNGSVFVVNTLSECN